MHIDQAHMDPARGIDHDPALIEKPVVRELLLDKDQGLFLVDDLVLPAEHGLLGTEGKYAAGLGGSSCYAGIEDLAPCFDLVVFDNLAYRDIGHHQVFFERGGESLDRRLGYRIDQHFAGDRVPELDDPVIDRCANADFDPPGCLCIGGFNLLHKSLYRNGISRDRFQQLRDRAVRAEQDLLDLRQPAHVLFNIPDIARDIHPINLISGTS